MNPRPRAPFPVGILFLLSMVVGAAVMYGLLAAQHVPGTSPVGAQSSQPAGRNTDAALALQDAIVKASDKIAPSVVNIDTTQYVRTNPFDQMFGQGPVEQGRGIGSGVIVSADGFILTNNHVVQNASDILVTLNDGRKLKGRLQGADPISDIAVVKVDATGLPAATLGNSDDLPVGAFVIAVGSPYGFEHTVTLGVLSARHRSIPEADKEFRDLLQTDAAINPGNSGGPLVDVEGRVVGVNTAIIQQAQGLGFAIPINSAKGTMDQLIANGHVVRPYLGVVMQPMTAGIAQYLQMPRAEGVVVRQVVPDSPAARAGLAQGDVLLAVDGTKVNDPSDTQKLIRAHKVGDKLQLELWSNGQVRNVTVQVAEMPAQPQAQPQP
jgi:serine protease Do